MVSKASIDAQLKKLDYNLQGWGKGEVSQLPEILLEDEQIYELVNGIYEGGFAMLVATDIRMLLIDKKPLNFLVVEDLRFDMISELDYNHRLFGARVSVSAGSKNLHFRSYNQPRLRKLITHVQNSMAAGKKKQDNHQSDQNQHLEQINQQLQEYLVAQHQQQERLHKQLKQAIADAPNSSRKTKKSGKPAQAELDLQPVKPTGKLADYLFAQSLLARHKKESNKVDSDAPQVQQTTTVTEATSPKHDVTVRQVVQQTLVSGQGDKLTPDVAELYNEGMNEIYGRTSAALPKADQADQIIELQPNKAQALPEPSAPKPKLVKQFVGTAAHYAQPLEVNAMRIAYAKLPLALRNRKFGSPSFHAHSRADELLQVARSSNAAVAQ